VYYRGQRHASRGAQHAKVDDRTHHLGDGDLCHQGLDEVAEREDLRVLPRDAEDVGEDGGDCGAGDGSVRAAERDGAQDAHERLDQAWALLEAALQPEVGVGMLGNGDGGGGGAQGAADGGVNDVAEGLQHLQWINWA
jgi:hypothetical protein